MKNMLGSFTKHRHIIHGGYTFAGTGAWMLQVNCSKLSIFNTCTPFAHYLGWRLHLRRVFFHVQRVRHPACDARLREQHQHQRPLRQRGRMEPGQHRQGAVLGVLPGLEKKISFRRKKTLHEMLFIFQCMVVEQSSLLVRGQTLLSPTGQP